MEMQQFLQENSWWIILVALWSLPWKGWALWKAAQTRDKVWFVILLVVNTMGLLEIYYIYFQSKNRKPTDSIPPSQPQI